MPVQGELTLDGRSGKWTASIGGYEEPVTKVGPRLSFSLPGRIGSFKDGLDSVSHTLQGEWIQPGGVILDPQYASPIRFKLISAHVWRGAVVPLEQRLSRTCLVLRTTES